jgi:hypothetical protein
MQTVRPSLRSKEPIFEPGLSREYQIQPASLLSEAATIYAFNGGSCGAYCHNEI